MDPNIQHFNLAQNPRSGQAILEKCNCNNNSKNEVPSTTHTALTRTCHLIQKTNNQVWFCNLINQKQSWRRKESFEIPVDLKYLEEKLKRQIKESSRFIANQSTDKFLEVEIEDTGILTICDHIEAGEYQENLIREYRLNHQHQQRLNF